VFWIGTSCFACTVLKLKDFALNVNDDRNAVKLINELTIYFPLIHLCVP